jgi:hypothetical protein
VWAKLSFQDWREGGSPLNITAFLCFQISQAGLEGGRISSEFQLIEAAFDRVLILIGKMDEKLMLLHHRKPTSWHFILISQA